MCVYIYMDVHIYIYMYVRIYVYIYIYIQPVHFYVFTNVRIKYTAIRTVTHEVLGISETFFKS